MNWVALRSVTLNVVFERFDVLVMVINHMVGVVIRLGYYNFGMKIKNGKVKWLWFQLKKNVFVLSNLVGEGLEQLMPVGNVTCNGFVKSELLSLLNDQFSASNVKSSQLWLMDRAVWTSRSWFTSRLLISMHSSWRNCDTRGVNRGNGPGFVASGLNPVEYRRARGPNKLKFGVGDASLENSHNF